MLSPVAVAISPRKRLADVQYAIDAMVGPSRMETPSHPFSLPAAPSLLPWQSLFGPRVAVAGTTAGPGGLSSLDGQERHCLLIQNIAGSVT